jgi:hypothetical protein
MGMCLFIFIGYLLNEFGFFKDEGSLYWAYGPVSLIFPAFVVIPMILMIRDSYKHYLTVKPYYPNGYKNRDKNKKQ